MIHADLQHAARALGRTAEINPGATCELIPLLGVGLVIAHRELLLHLWQQEEVQ